MDNSSEVEVVVVVVDNDAAGSAAAVVQAIEASYPWPLHYVVQPDRGIPQARNLAVAVARELGGDLLGFIDDDEEPASDWFVRSLESCQRTGAHVVMGRSMPVFHGDPPQWVMQGRFFERPRFATDEPIRWNFARTSGVLISMKSFPPLERPFDERLRLTGGSDTRFFQCIERAGGIIVWADDAVVLDHVPASRASWRWLIRRSFRTGNNRSLFLLYFEHPSFFRKVKRLGRGTTDALRGLWQLVPGVARGRVGLVRASQQIANGLGVALGALGIRYDEYRRTSDS